MPFLDVFGINILAEDKTKPAIDSAIKGTTRLEQAQAGVAEAIKTGSREMMAMGHNLTSLGTFLIVASTNMGDFKGIAEGTGVALGGVGSAITILGEGMRMAKVLMYGQMIPALAEYAAALWASYAAEIAVTGGIALVGGAIALYMLSTRQATTAQYEFKSEIQRTGDALKDTISLLNEQKDIQDQLAGIPKDLAKAELTHQSAVLDVADAMDRLNEATTTYGLGSREYQRAAIAHDQALTREQETLDAVNGLTQKKVDLQVADRAAKMDLINLTTTTITSMKPPVSEVALLGTTGTETAPRSVTFSIQNLQLSPSDTLQAWAEREQRFRSGVPTI